MKLLRISVLLKNNEHLAVWLGVLFAIIGSSFAYIEYQNSVKVKRVDRSLQLISEYFSGEDESLKASLSRILDAVNTEASHIEIPIGISREEQRKLYSETRIKAQKSKANSIMDLYSFYQRAIHCADKSLCDRTTLIEFLGQDILAYINSSCEFIAEEEAKWNADLSLRLFNFLVRDDWLYALPEPDDDSDSYFFCQQFRDLEQEYLIKNR